MPPLSSALLALPLLLAACSGKEDVPLGSGGGDGGGVSERCPNGMTEVAAATVDLGETDTELLETYFGSAIPLQRTTLGDYCIGTFPLPGFAGQDWTTDGLAVQQLEQVETLLAAHNRRLCTTAELLYGAAGPENWRHPYAAEQRDDTACDPDDQNPSPLGTFPGCESPLGLRDFEVRSSWSVLDETTASGLYEAWPSGFPGGGRYAAYGATSDAATYYAPTNFSVHFHGDGEDPYTNNGLRVCADVDRVDSAVEADWTASITTLREVGTFAVWLDPSLATEDTGTGDTGTGDTGTGDTGTGDTGTGDTGD